MRMFISYTLRDRVLNPLLLAQLESVLSQVGIPYIDILHNSSPHPQKYVMRMLSESSIFVACVTPQFYQSEWVQLEYKMARKLGLPIISLDCWSLVSSSGVKEPRSNNEVAVVLNQTQKIHRQEGVARTKFSAGLPMGLELKTL